ncbi:hypothetical protein ACFVHB_36150 [Kitasatospora sp. NPDC127111]|uniref:hypothetical protein n=1 Tax=Kitasatospora sp. NPDC127111 TaxID=3345363 RepID=UPI00362B1CB4
MRVFVRTRHPDTAGSKDRRPRDYHWHEVDTAGGSDRECVVPPAFHEPLPSAGVSLAAFDQLCELLHTADPVPVFCLRDRIVGLALFLPAVPSRRHRFSHGARVEFSLLLLDADTEVAARLLHLARSEAERLATVLDEAVRFDDESYDFSVDWPTATAGLETAGDGHGPPEAAARGEGVIAIGGVHLPPALPAPAERGWSSLTSCLRGLWAPQASATGTERNHEQNERGKTKKTKKVEKTEKVKKAEKVEKAEKAEEDTHVGPAGTPGDHPADRRPPVRDDG